MSSLRVGRKVGRTIYIQTGDGPADTDILIGVMDTREWAKALVAVYNATLDEPATPPGLDVVLARSAEAFRPNASHACALVSAADVPGLVATIRRLTAELADAREVRPAMGSQGSTGSAPAEFKVDPRFRRPGAS